MKVLLQCRNHEGSGDTIELDCELDHRGYIDFDEGPHGVATDQGEQYEFELHKGGIIDFGREYEGDRLWHTDLHQLKMQVGVPVKVVVGGPTWSYEIVSVQ